MVMFIVESSVFLFCFIVCMPPLLTSYDNNVLRLVLYCSPTCGAGQSVSQCMITLPIFRNLNYPNTQLRSSMALFQSWCYRRW